MTTPRTAARRVLAGLGCLGLTTGAGLVVAVGATAAAPGGLNDETLVLPLAGRYDPCTSGATLHSFTMEGEATGPRSGHYVARVTAQVDGPSVVSVVDVTIGTSDGDLRITQTAVADLGPAGACAPLEPGEVLTWTAEVPGQGADAGTAVLSGEPAALVDSLTSTQPNDSDVPTGTPTDIPSGTPTAAPTGEPVPIDEPVPDTPVPNPMTLDADITFRYSVEARAGRLAGTCDVQGGTEAALVHVVCTDVRTYERHGHVLAFSGHGTLNGRATTYWIRIVDGRGPGAGRDSFVIRAGDDYLGGGELTSGDLRVR